MMLLQRCTQCASKFGKLSNGHRTGKDKFSFQSQRRTITKNVQTSVVMYGCESWMIKKGWAPRKWCFLTVVLVKTLESPLDCKEIKQVNPKGNEPRMFTGRTDVEAEAPVLCHLIRRSDSLERTLMLGKIEGRRRSGWQRMRWLDSITNSMDMNWSKLREIVKDREAWHAADHWAAKSRT